MSLDCVKLRQLLCLHGSHSWTTGPELEPKKLPSGLKLAHLNPLFAWLFTSSLSPPVRTLPVSMSLRTQSYFEQDKRNLQLGWRARAVMGEMWISRKWTSGFGWYGCRPIVQLTYDQMPILESELPVITLSFNWRNEIYRSAVKKKQKRWSIITSPGKKTTFETVPLWPLRRWIIVLVLVLKTTAIWSFPPEQNKKSTLIKKF